MTGRFGAALIRQAARIGERRAERTALRLSDELRVILPDILIIADRGRLRLSARGLLHRWLTDGALRWLGRVLR